MAKPELVAVTGGTGFIGQAVVRALLNEGYRVRLFARHFSSKVLFPGYALELVTGDLLAGHTQKALLQDADRIIHIAGATKSWDQQGFYQTNRDLTVRLLNAGTRWAPTAHWVLISSLAAKAAHLSPYAGSKFAAEQALAGSDISYWTILRPPAVYGPGDDELLPLFRAANRGFLPLPMYPDSRVAMIHVADLAARIIEVLNKKNSINHSIIEVSDGNEDGYTPQQLLPAFSEAFGRDLRLILIPFWLLHMAAWFNRVTRRFQNKPPMLMPHKLPELHHRDWGLSPSNILGRGLSEPRIALPEGLRDTLHWYKQHIKNF